ncbi:MAG: hypothetical protein HKN29_10005 [Rhodothermales bacterium]|nr:hypothetical protein [Rhodothermales bacterium]
MLTQTGCSSSRTAEVSLQEVEGMVTVRGNEPFTVVMLQTKEDNWYILDLTPEQRTGLVNPSVQRARGTVYLGDWNGNPFAHFRVAEIERVIE